MALLVGPKHLGGAERVNPLGAFALVLASTCVGDRVHLLETPPYPNSAMLGVAMQTIAGGTALLVVAGSAVSIASYIWRR